MSYYQKSVYKVINVIIENVYNVRLCVEDNIYLTNSDYSIDNKYLIAV